MPTTVEAIYENGVLKPLSKITLKEHKKYTVSLEESAPENDWLTAPLPQIGNIVFHEDPATPLDPEDWPEESR
ncbi:MAG: antitoxin family protein [Deltaproteobacteria bacterium]|nr:antitoxin family protein [Deltaproteobacteria bacterium]MBN2673694.1 antitoxin family protein [Deltaproteobacteria bacterium]